MNNCAVIIDNRPSKKLDEIIQKHMDCLPDWKLIHFSNLRINSYRDYNRILTNVEFWRALRYNRVLIFQHDSMLLREGIDEFMEYDYIGAPIKNFPFPAMNGGLSLRNPKAMIECLSKRPPNLTKYENHNEDIYFSYICRDLGFNIPTMSKARQFSVETIYGLGSLGIHAANKYLSPTEMNKILTQYE